MNRIKELQEQCVIRKGTVLDFDYDKFAELIVKECANKVKDFYQEDEFSCYNAGEEIKQHFGVE